MTHEPITTIADLDTLDSDEIVEGYRDGRSGEPEPGNNRSRSYWHGWRNGMVDGGRLKLTPEMGALGEVVISSGYLRNRD